MDYFNNEDWGHFVDLELYKENNSQKSKSYRMAKYNKYSHSRRNDVNYLGTIYEEEIWYEKDENVFAENNNNNAFTEPDDDDKKKTDISIMLYILFCLTIITCSLILG